MRRTAVRALAIHVALTAAVLVYLILVWRSPDLSLSDLCRMGPRTNPTALGVSLAFIWLLATVILILAVLRKINAGNVVLVVSGAAVALVYLVFVSERFYFGDYKAYIHAAENIIHGQPFHSRYIYPPLLASVLAHIYRALGSQAAVLACFIMNHLSLWAFFILGSMFLRRSGLSLHLSSILLAVAMIANVPVLRNVKYVQTNLSYTDLILAAILLLPKSRLLSAVSLAVGTHLKVLPVLLLPLFAFTKKYLWLLYYTVAGLAIVLVTTLTDGGSYYLDFFHNLSGWEHASLLSATIDSFVVNTNRYLGVTLPAQAISITLKVALILWLYFLARCALRKKAFFRSGDQAFDTLANGALPLLFLGPAISPTVWVHHLVVLIIPAVLLSVRLLTRRRILLFTFGYSFTFLLPAIGCYPWSFLRLAGWLMLLILMSDCVLKPGISSWVGRIDQGLASIIEGTPLKPGSGG
jgi:hypothetical protein